MVAARPLPTLLAVVALAGCGSASVHELPPAAEPRDSPPLTERPAGRVVRLGPPIARLTAGRTTAPGGAPEGLAVDPASGVVAVGLRRPPELALVDAASGLLRRRVALPGGPRHLALAAHGTFLVPAETADRLLAVRATDGRVTRDVPVAGRPHAVAAGPGGAVAGAEQGSMLDVVTGDRVAARVAVATQPGGLTVVGRDRMLAVVSVRERVLELYDARPPFRRIARVPAGVGPTHAVSLGGLVWVADTQGDALLVFRLRPHLELVRRVRLPGGPYGIALDPGRRRLWVTLTGTNTVAELPAHGRPHVLRTFPTVRQPNGVAVDSRTGRVFVGGRADGVLQLLDPAATRAPHGVGGG